MSNSLESTNAFEPDSNLNSKNIEVIKKESSEEQDDDEDEDEEEDEDEIHVIEEEEDSNPAMVFQTSCCLSISSEISVINFL